MSDYPNYKPAFIYSVSASMLTPISSISEISQYSGVMHTLIGADSEQDAIARVMDRIAEEYKGDPEIAVIRSPENKTVCIMDEAGHIVNHYWHFRTHRV